MGCRVSGCRICGRVWVRMTAWARHACTKRGSLLGVPCVLTPYWGFRILVFKLPHDLQCTIAYTITPGTYVQSLLH